MTMRSATSCKRCSRIEVKYLNDVTRAFEPEVVGSILAHRKDLCLKRLDRLFSRYGLCAILCVIVDPVAGVILLVSFS